MLLMVVRCRIKTDSLRGLSIHWDTNSYRRSETAFKSGRGGLSWWLGRRRTIWFVTSLRRSAQRDNIRTSGKRVSASTAHRDTCLHLSVGGGNVQALGGRGRFLLA